MSAEAVRGIKQLKQFLHCRGVRVPGSITEKADLVALVEESKVGRGLFLP